MVAQNFKLLWKQMQYKISQHDFSEKIIYLYKHTYIHTNFAQGTGILCQLYTSHKSFQCEYQLH